MPVPKKIFLWETESVIALDMIRIFSKLKIQTRIIRKTNDILHIFAEGSPELLVLSTDSDLETINFILSGISETRNGTQIIIISTMTEKILKENLNDCAGEYKYLAKPFGENELYKCLNELQQHNTPELGN